MGAGRKTETFYDPANSKAAPGNNSKYQKFRNLDKSDLGGVIFGCKNNTMEECLTKNLFGLPAIHYSYIRNIDSGLPLFLFNYSDRQMHGIFEAAEHGQMNIDPYAWSDDGTIRTPYPAQVRILTKTSCLPLSEPQFKKAIGGNYFNSSHFSFELDRAQTRKLISLFNPANLGYQPLSVPPSVDIPPSLPRNAQENFLRKQTLLNDLKTSDPASAHAQDSGSSCKAESSEQDFRDNWEVQHTWANNLEWENYNNDAKSGLDAVHDNNDLCFESTQFGATSGSGFDEHVVLNRLRALALEKEELMGYTPENPENDLSQDAEPNAQNPKELSGLGHLQLPQSNGNHDLMEFCKELVVQTTEMQKKQMESDKEVKWLNNIVRQAERKIFQLESRIEELEQGLSVPAQDIIQSDKLIYLVGGFDKIDWLSSFDAFVPSNDRLIPLTKMSCARAYTSVAGIGEVIYVLGGGDGIKWSDSAACYNRITKSWIEGPRLSRSKGSLAGIALGGKIFAMGGGDGENYFSCMEILDASVGKWVYSESMNEKRFALAATEFNGAIYAVGGYDGKCYLRSAERYDPREGCWARLPSMTERRGCFSLATINEKLYAVGGYNGLTMVSSVEIFDPRLPSWVPGMPMQKPRGYAASAVIDETLYVMGGLSIGNEVVEIVECFDERNGWYAPGFKSIGKRCFFSAVAI